MPGRLARKLMFSITVIVVIVAAVSGLVNIRNEEDKLLYTMTLGADQLSRSITSATWQAMLDDHRQAAYDVMQTIASQEGIERIRMFNRTGEVRFSTIPGDYLTSVGRSAQPCAICHAPGARRVKLDLASRVHILPAGNNRRRLEVITPIYNDKSCSQAACHAHPAEMRVIGVLELGLNLDSVDKEVANMKLRMLLVTAVEATLIGVFIIFFTRRFLARPIARLIDGFKAVSEMDLDKPLSTSNGSEELDEMARSFNLMRDRLRAALEELNQFTQKLETKVEERTQQLRTAQKKLVQSDRLASLGQLSASVAHEINNPVSGVLNLSMLMQRMLKEDGIPPNRIQDFRKYLGQVTAETSRVGRIVSDLLAFSRRGKPQRAPADLNRIVKMTLSLVQHKMKLSNVAVEARLAEDLPMASCDSSQIQQVALNLILNAAEATHNKSERRVEVSTIKGDGEILLVVTDNGEGIPPENLSKIFDPFFTTKAEGKGVGLGLAVTYGIIHAHGGDIEVKSVVGEGTTFTASLPLEQPARQGEPPLLELTRDG